MPRVQININKVAFITNKETYSKNTLSFIVGIFAIHFQQNKRTALGFFFPTGIGYKGAKKRVLEWKGWRVIIWLLNLFVNWKG